MVPCCEQEPCWDGFYFFAFTSTALFAYTM